MSSPAKSCSLDPIPTSMLIQNVDFLIDCITAIVNESLSSGTMPECLKHAIISPLLKKQSLDRNEFKNYRPVSNLTFVSKIIDGEDVIASQKGNEVFLIFESKNCDFCFKN